MTAGLKFRCRIWRMTQQDDDVAGGAVYSGSVVANNLQSSFIKDAPNPLIVQQGLEWRETARALVRHPLTVTIYERDQYEIVYPRLHPEYMQRWRVTSMQEGASISPYDKRRVIKLRLERIERNRTELEQ